MYQSSRIQDFFTTELPAFASSLTTSTDFGVFVHFFYLFLLVLLIVKEVIYFVQVGSDMFRIVYSVILVFITLFLLETFGFLADMLWGVSEGLRETVQEAATGEPNSLALGDYLNRSSDSMSTEPVSIFGAFSDWVKGLFFYGMVLILRAVAWVASQWALIGYSFSLIVGPVFIPMLLLDTTRPMFNGFIQLFFSFLIYNFFIGAVLSMIVLFFKYVIFGVSATDWSVSGIFLSLTESVDVSVYLALFVLFLLSLSALASAVAGAGVSAAQAGLKAMLIASRIRFGGK